MDSRGRVLLIDDDAMFRRVIKRVLLGGGYEVIDASTVRVAMRLFRESKFDIVVTDLYMPDEDGMDALRQLRAARSTVPVVVLSGQLVGEFGSTLKDVLFSLGTAAVVPKTFDSTPKLLALVGKLCGKEPSGEVAAFEPPAIAATK